MKRRILAFLLIVCLLMPLSVAFAERPLGDVDGNGSVTAADAALLLRSVVGLSLLDTESRRYADLNEDGIIQASDAALLLRSLVGLGDVTDPIPTPTVPPTPSPSPTTYEWYDEVVTGLGSPADANTALAISAFIAELDADDPYREVLIAALNYMGVDYDTMDCSAFVKQAFRDCGYGRSVINGNSQGMLELFRENGILRNAKDEDGNLLYSSFRPGSVLIYVDDNGTANHVALYLGKVNGSYYLMDASTSRDAICIRTVWDWSKWHLTYFADPI